MYKRFFSVFITVLMLALLCGTAAAEAALVELSTDERAAVNLFLSNFTETGVESIDDFPEDCVLVDFAHDHLWFNDYESFEYGDYANGNNCRVSDERIRQIIGDYFYDPRSVDLSQTRFDYIDGCYYHFETGGWSNDGFAHTVSACSIGDDKYFVSFLVFGGGEAWDNSVMDDSMSEAESGYGHPNGYGSALIYASDLSDRNTYKMISYSRL